MKAILMSIRPQWVAKMLNGEKTIEIRKKFPSDYVGWVYIYCTKGKPYLYYYQGACRNEYVCSNKKVGGILNGKVVARFWCDKVEEILLKQNGNYYTNTLSNNKLLTQSCLTQREMFDYLAGNWHQKFNYWYGGCAIHITKVDPFDKPKKIGEFYTTRLDQDITKLFANSIQLETGTWVKPLTRAPQSWYYVEV